MARAPSHIQILKNVSLFSACSDRDLKKIAGLCTAVEVPEGRVLAREGKPGREFYAIVDGKAKVTLRRKTLSILGPGDFFGEMALLDAGPRTATVTAETDMELFVLEPREFATLIDQYPSVAKKLLKGLATRLRTVEKAPSH